MCSRLSAGGLRPNDGRKDDDAQDTLDYAGLRQGLELQAKLARNGRGESKEVTGSVPT